MPPNEWVIKKGKNVEIMPLILKETIVTIEYYLDLFKSASIEKLILRYAFTKTATKYNNFFYTFIVNEVGFKLSKRKEKSRPNQLCTFRGQESGKKLSNLHLYGEPVSVTINTKEPETVLDIIKKEVKWE